MRHDTAVILVAAGQGSRMGGGLAKQWRILAGQPVLAHAAASFRAAGLTRLIAAIRPEDAPRAAALGLPWVAGGASRARSVRNALEHLAADPPARVLIHDGARPLVGPDLITRVLAALDNHKGAAPALPVSDALWRAEAGLVRAIQPRDGLFRAQTPQGFAFSAILSAHRAHHGEAADDVAVALQAGLDVAVIEGAESNLKLTYPADFIAAERHIAKGQTTGGQTMDIRTGNGFDVHRFGPGDRLWLCGVEIAHDSTLQGHSDADVGMHALTDALYGALAEGDIGRHFPPSDPQWKGAASDIFLRHATELARQRGYAITHTDVTLICEQPRIGPHAAAMRARLATIMGIEPERVSVKATTSERLGFTGREEGIAALATATLVKP